MPTKAKTVKVYRGDTTPFLACRFYDPVTEVIDGKTVIVYETINGKKIAKKGPVTDVSTYDWVAQWRPDADSSIVKILDVEVDRADEGLIFVKASAAITETMTGNGTWDLQATKPGGEVETKFYGSTLLVKDISRDVVS